MKTLLSSRKVLICVGAGGVGKTTISAALALSAVWQGKKVLVMTIDPAKRLANALGLDELGNQEKKVDLSSLQSEGRSPTGELHAMMLDHKQTFDQLVSRYSKTTEGAEKLLNNKWYQQMSDALIGVQDYMAVEKLFEMVHEKDYDLIVLDTPPSSNAIDFMNAPHRMLDLLDSEIVKWFHKTLRDKGSASRFLKWGSSAVFKALGKITGQGVLEEILVLLDDLSELYDGLRERAQQTYALLRSKDCHFFVISSPQRLPLLEALFFKETLDKEGMTCSAFWLNRVKNMGHWEGQWLFYPRKQEWKPLVSDSPFVDSECFLSLQQHFEKKQTELEQVLQEVDFLKRHSEQIPIGLIPLIPQNSEELLEIHQISQVILGTF